MDGLENININYTIFGWSWAMVEYENLHQETFLKFMFNLVVSVCNNEQ